MTDLDGFLDECFDDELDVADVFLRAAEAGLDLAEITQALLRDDDDDAAAVVHGLVDHLGSIEEAREVLARVEGWHDRRLEPLVAAHAADAAIAVAFRDADDVDAILDLLEDPALPPRQRAYRLQHLVDQLTPVAAVGLGLRRHDRTTRDVVTAVLSELGAEGPVAILVHLRDAGLAAGDLIEVLSRFCDVHVDATLAPDLALIDAHAALLAAHGRDVRAAIPGDDASPTVWLPILRRHGWKASAAVLHLLEREPPSSLPAIARALSEAGYTTDLLAGFVENGCGTQRSLALLGNHGWHVDTMVSALLAQGLLAPDIRDHLLELRLSRAAIIDVLLRHIPADVVALVLPPDRHP